MDIINVGISVKNDDNGSSSNVNSPKSNGTNLTGDKNRSVKDISKDISKNKVELKEISGFGDIKIEKYGDALLKIINIKGQ